MLYKVSPVWNIIDWEPVKPFQKRPTECLLFMNNFAELSVLDTVGARTSFRAGFQCDGMYLSLKTTLKSKQQRF